MEFLRETLGKPKQKEGVSLSPASILRLGKTKTQKDTLLGIHLDKDFRRAYKEGIQSKITVERKGLEETITVEVERDLDSGAY